MSDKQILLAEITAPHGLHGWVKIKCHAENVENLKAYSPLQNADGTQQFIITGIKMIGQIPAIKIDGIKDRNMAEGLRGIQLFVLRERLPELSAGEYYHSDLIGLTAMDQQAQPIGTVMALHNFGAGDLLEIQIRDGQSQMVPFKQDYVGEPNWENKTLNVNLPKYID